MAEVNRWLLARIRLGSRWALDLGGGTGRLGPELRRLGYHYANVDPSAVSMGAVKGVGEQLPFRDGSLGSSCRRTRSSISRIRASRSGRYAG
jgi:predicted TPR repeat methyltransferase